MCLEVLDILVDNLIDFVYYCIFGFMYRKCLVILRLDKWIDQLCLRLVILIQDEYWDKENKLKLGIWGKRLKQVMVGDWDGQRFGGMLIYS